MSAILTESTLRKQFLDSKPKWDMGAYLETFFNHTDPGTKSYEHFNRGTTFLGQLLERVQVSKFCERKRADVQADLENGWICSECGYKPGETSDFKPEKYLKLI